MFRRSTRPPSPQSESSSDSESSPGDDASPKKARFSMFRAGERRSSFMLEPSFFCDTSMYASPLASDDEPSSFYSSDGESTTFNNNRGSVDSTDARRRALDILEGRTETRLALNRRASSAMSAEGDAQGATAPGARSRPKSMTLPMSFRNALQRASAIPSRPGSVASRRSMSNDERRPSSRLDRVPEDGTIGASPGARFSLAPESEEPEIMNEETEQEQPRAQETDEHGLPTYASAAFPARPTTYRFTQAGPFGSTVSAGDEEEITGLGRYHVSVGVNIWAPRSAVTTVRRGLAEDGPIVGQIE